MIAGALTLKARLNSEVLRGKKRTDEDQRNGFGWVDGRMTEGSNLMRHL